LVLAVLLFCVGVRVERVVGGFVIRPERMVIGLGRVIVVVVVVWVWVGAIFVVSLKREIVES
jgi:hypothetical protein